VQRRSEHAAADARLVSPCACRGSAAFVHVGCLKQWHAALSAAVIHCPTCEQPYVGDVAVVLARLR
jgi:E3 ubiquitin-protein ligase DOA10